MEIKDEPITRIINLIPKTTKNHHHFTAIKKNKATKTSKTERKNKFIFR